MRRRRPDNGRFWRALLNGGVAAVLTLTMLSCAGRVLAPEVFDNFPPPPPDVARDQQVLGYAFVVSAAAIGLLVGARSVKRRPDLPDQPICRCCGYNLTGNVSGVCPECGEAVDHAT